MNSSIYQVITQHLGSLAQTFIYSVFIIAHYKELKCPKSSKYSTFWPRLWTGNIDGLVLWPIGLLTGLLCLIKAPFIVATATMITQLSFFVYSVWMHSKYGQTVGKKACKVKIVCYETELPITFKQALLRDLIPILFTVILLPRNLQNAAHPTIKPMNSPMHSIWTAFGSVVCVWFLIEIVTMLSNKRRRALHDFIAGTVVIRTNIPHEDLSTTPVLEATPA